MDARPVGGRRERKLALSFAFRPELADALFTPVARAELARWCDILDPAPMSDFSGPRAAALLARTEILVTGWGCPPVGRATLAAAPRLRLVAHAAGSIKAFLDPAVLAEGVAVVNAASANAIPVAEFTLAAILFANKQVLAFRDAYRRDREGVANASLAASSAGNAGKTVGVIGASRIGRRVMALLRPFDLHVLLHDPFVDEGDAARLGVELSGLDALFARADIVSLHAPALPATERMVDARRLGLMRDGATFINTARGSLVDHAALTRELVSGRLSAVIDVTDPEILPASSPLYDLPNVLLTPHIAGATGAERARLGDLVVGEIRRFVCGEPLAYGVEAATLERQA